MRENEINELCKHIIADIVGCDISSIEYRTVKQLRDLIKSNVSKVAYKEMLLKIYRDIECNGHITSDEFKKEYLDD